MNKQEKTVLEKLKHCLLIKGTWQQHEDLDSSFEIIGDLLNGNYYGANAILEAMKKDNTKECDKCKKPMTILKGAHWGRLRIPAGWKCESCNEKSITVWGGASG